MIQTAIHEILAIKAIVQRIRRDFRAAINARPASYAPADTVRISIFENEDKTVDYVLTRDDDLALVINNIHGNGNFPFFSWVTKDGETLAGGYIR